MKTIARAAILAVLSVSPVWAQQGWTQPAQMYDARPKITVTGEAVVNVEPDKIVLSFGIETSDAEITAAKAKNSDVLKQAVAAIKGLGVQARDIQTDQLSLEPRYSDGYRKESFLGFFARNTFVVTLTDTKKVEELVTKVLQAGVNYIHGIDFQTSDLRKYRDQARELALKAARDKAKRMADVLGQAVGSPIQINENGSGSPWNYYSSWSGWGYGRGQGMTQNVMQDIPGGSGEISDTVALGKIAIRASVTVTFELTK
jgi:uncharacterized protein